MEAKIGQLLREESSGGIFGFSQYRRRFHMLDATSLYCFAQPPDLTPQSRILVQSGVLLQPLQRENAIMVTEVATRTVCKLTGDTAEDIADWTRALELAASGREGTVLKMGYLQREVIGRWGARRVWVVLDQGVLFTFRKPPEFNPTAVLPLDRQLQVSVGEVDSDGSAAFELRSGFSMGTGRPHVWRLKAEDRLARDEWLEAIAARLENAPKTSATDALGASAGRIERRGWLQKLSGGVADSGWLASFRPRYVVITNGMLLYFAKVNSRDIP